MSKQDKLFHLLNQNGRVDCYQKASACGLNKIEDYSRFKTKHKFTQMLNEMSIKQNNREALYVIYDIVMSQSM